MEDVRQFSCRRHSGVNCLMLCNLHVTNGCHKCAVHDCCGVFSQSYWFPIKTCTQWPHSRGSGGGAAWNFRKRKSFHVSIAYLFMQIVFASQAFTYLLFISLSWYCSYFLWAHVVKEKVKVYNERNKYPCFMHLEATWSHNSFHLFLKT